MTRKRKLIVAGAAGLAIAAGAVGIAQAVDGGDSEEQVKGPDADRAKSAALSSVGGGRVVGVEREDDGRAGWEVEVVRTDGSEVEVHLNEDLERVGLESDDDGDDGEREAGDDD